MIDWLDSSLVSGTCLGTVPPEFLTSFSCLWRGKNFCYRKSRIGTSVQGGKKRQPVKVNGKQNRTWKGERERLGEQKRNGKFKCGERWWRTVLRKENVVLSGIPILFDVRLHPEITYFLIFLSLGVAKIWIGCQFSLLEETSKE